MNKEKMFQWVSAALELLKTRANYSNNYVTMYDRMRLYKTNDGHADHVFSLGDLLDMGRDLNEKINMADQDNGNDALVHEVIAYVGLAANAKEII